MYGQLNIYGFHGLQIIVLLKGYDSGYNYNGLQREIRFLLQASYILWLKTVELAVLIVDTSLIVKVYRSGVQLSSPASYVPGESLTVSMT